MATLEQEIVKPGEDRWPRTRKFTRDEYRAMPFRDEERTELIDGLVYLRGERKSDTMSPIGAEHVYVLNSLREYLREAFSGVATVMSGAPTILSDDTEPEPDIVVVRGDLKRYARRLPKAEDVILSIEISFSTLEFDRTVKARKYAESGISEYWIVNLPDRQIEIHRDPASNGNYRTKLIVTESDTVAPLESLGSLLLVSDVLP